MKRVRKYSIDHPVTIHQSELTGVDFENKRLKLSKNGAITVKASPASPYVWDGCSPKIRLFGKVFGVWDGPVDPKTGKQVAYAASLFHDALTQFMNTHPLTPKQNDRLFYQLLGNFPLAPIYYAGVRLYSLAKHKKKYRVKFSD